MSPGSNFMLHCMRLSFINLSKRSKACFQSGYPHKRAGLKHKESETVHSEGEGTPKACTWAGLCLGESSKRCAEFIRTRV